MITKDNNYKVMKLFFDAPEKRFHIRQIARLTRLSAPGVAKIVARLKGRELLLSEKNGVVENVFASKNERFMHIKRCYNIFRVLESGVLEVLRSRYEEPEAIVLFGSFARGEDTSKSDIDLAVAAREDAERLDLKKFETMLGRKLNVYPIRIKECKDEFLNNLANGIVLHGYLKVIA